MSVERGGCVSTEDISPLPPKENITPLNEEGGPRSRRHLFTRRPHYVSNDLSRTGQLC